MSDSNPFTGTGGQNGQGDQPAPQYGAGETPRYDAPAGQPANPYGTPQYNAPQYNAPQYSSPQYAQQPQQPQQPSGNPFTQPYAGAAPSYTGGSDNGAGNEPPLWMPWYGISFGNAVVRFFKKYAVFSGRASRGEYWWVFLFMFLVNFAFNLLREITDGGFFSLLNTLWSLATIVPMLALSVRRLHDTDKPGPWLLLPYGLIMLGFVLAAFGGASVVYSAMYSTYYGYYNGGMGGSAAMSFIGLLLVVVGCVLDIVLFAMASKPEGARFDRPEGGAPYAGANAYAAANQQNPYQQPQQPYQPNGYAGYQAPGAAPQGTTGAQGAGYQGGYGQPTYAQPTYAQPAYGQPTYGQGYAQQPSQPAQPTQPAQPAQYQEPQQPAEDGGQSPYGDARA